MLCARTVCVCRFAPPHVDQSAAGPRVRGALFAWDPNGDFATPGDLGCFRRQQRVWPEVRGTVCAIEPVGHAAEATLYASDFAIGAVGDSSRNGGTDR